METALLTRTTSCPLCGGSFTREAMIFGGRELYANVPCLCPKCDADRARAVSSSKATFRELWERTVPEDYQSATPQQVPAALRDAIRWQPLPNQKGLGIHGPSGHGKSHAMALLALHLEIPFEWITGAAMRQLATDAAMLDGRARDAARRRLSELRECRLLIIDDIAEVKFTEAWADRLFEVLEYRNSTRRLTCWTAQHGPGQIADRIAAGRGVDPGTGEAIERRLCQHHAVLRA